MAKNTDKQEIESMSDNFRGYAALLRKVKQRVQIAQQRAIYAANEEMLRMYWDIGGMLHAKPRYRWMGQEDLATVGCGFEERIFRDQRLHGTQYAVYDTVL